MQFNKVKLDGIGDYKKEKKRLSKTKVGAVRAFDFVVNKLIQEAFTKKPINPSDILKMAVLDGVVRETATHYFLESPELEEFLTNMVIADDRILDALRTDTVHYTKVPGAIESYDVEWYIGCVHAKSERPAITFVFIKASDNHPITIGTLRGTKMFWGQSFTSKDFNTIGKGPQTKDVQCILNMFLYMEAFPNAITNGAPSGDVLQYAGKKARTIKTHQSLLEHGTVSPHFRRGHFRRLESERYTNKRGQVVFVQSSFVKGHAVTVMEDEIAED